MRDRSIGWICAGALALCATCNAGAQTQEADAQTTFSEQQSAAKQWLRGELYFGIGSFSAATSAASHKRWRTFLDREVTPRFPDGFTVLDGDGQWRAPNAALPEREHSKVLVIVFEASTAHRAALEQIRDAWKRLTGDQSVLLVIAPAEVSF